MRLRGLFIGLNRVLEALVNLGNSEFHLLVKLGYNPSPNRNRILSELRSYLPMWFCHCGALNLENSISQWFVAYWVSFLMSLESPQSDILVQSYGQNTKTCAESKFKSNPIFYSNWWIPISSFPHLLGLPNLPFKLGNFSKTLPFLPCPKKHRKHKKKIKWNKITKTKKLTNVN